MKIQKLLFMLLFVMLLAALAACGTGNGNTANEPEPTQESPAATTNQNSSGVTVDVASSNKSEQDLYDKVDYVLLITPKHLIYEDPNSTGYSAFEDIQAAYQKQPVADPVIYTLRECTVLKSLKGDYSGDTITIAEKVVFGKDSATGEWVEYCNLTDFKMMEVGDSYLIYIAKRWQKEDGSYGCGLVDGCYGMEDFEKKMTDQEWIGTYINYEEGYTKTRMQIEIDAFKRYQTELELKDFAAFEAALKPQN